MENIAWTLQRATRIYELPLPQLIYKAHKIHKKQFNSNEIEVCSLLSIKTGACPEDCAYCPQSGHHNTNLLKENLLNLNEILDYAKKAKANGATRFCMGAAWRSPPKKIMPKLVNIIKAVNNIGLETCMTLGMLSEDQTEILKQAGLHFYNHNLDTSPTYYQKVISTRTYQERLDTLEKIGRHGIKVCCGGIIGMGEEMEDRIALLVQLANLKYPPKSVPINQLVRIKGTPLANEIPLDEFEFIRTIATARILIPKAIIRLSAGRAEMSEATQLLCFIAGANSMWLGNKLLTVSNTEIDRDRMMLKKFGMSVKQ